MAVYILKRPLTNVPRMAIVYNKVSPIGNTSLLSYFHSTGVDEIWACIYRFIVEAIFHRPTAINVPIATVMTKISVSVLIIVPFSLYRPNKRRTNARSAILINMLNVSGLPEKRSWNADPAKMAAKIVRPPRAL
jgi:hypothetical protein